MTLGNDLEAFKVELLRTYFKSAMFYKYNEKDLNDAIEAVGYKGKKEDIIGCACENAILRRNRRYAIFTDSGFWIQSKSGRIVRDRHSYLASVDLSGVVRILGENAVPVSTTLAKRLRGIEIISHLKDPKDLALAKYILSFEKPVFGEYVPVHYTDRKSDITNQIELGFMHRWLLSSLKIRRISVDSVDFEIALDDRALQHGSLSQWEDAVDEFVNNREIIAAFQRLFYSIFCVMYNPENIRFSLNGKIKTTLSTRIKNASYMAESVIEKASEIAQERMAQANRNYSEVATDMERRIDEDYKQGRINKKIYQIEKEKISKAKLATARKNGCANEKVQMQNKKRVAFQKGSGNVAFVFSCPGQMEEQAGRVCAGKTGENLEVLIRYLHEQRPDVFSSALRQFYTITNASDIVHYFGLTGDTEASYEEIAAADNIERLSDEIRSCRIVVCMGDRASYAISRSTFAGIVLKGEHLSLSNLNRKPVNGSTPEERNRQRVALVGDKILSQL